MKSHRKRRKNLMTREQKYTVNLAIRVQNAYRLYFKNLKEEAWKREVK